jgi:hypothetical protein
MNARLRKRIRKGEQGSALNPLEQNEGELEAETRVTLADPFPAFPVIVSAGSGEEGSGIAS